MLQFDRKIIISAAGSRNAVSWPTQSIFLSRLSKEVESGDCDRCKDIMRVLDGRKN